MLKVRLAFLSLLFFVAACQIKVSNEGDFPQVIDARISKYSILQRDTTNPENSSKVHIEPGTFALIPGAQSVFYSLTDSDNETASRALARIRLGDEGAVLERLVPLSANLGEEPFLLLSPDGPIWIYQNDEKELLQLNMMSGRIELDSSMSQKLSNYRDGDNPMAFDSQGNLLISKEDAQSDCNNPNARIVLLQKNNLNAPLYLKHKLALTQSCPTKSKIIGIARVGQKNFVTLESILENGQKRFALGEFRLTLLHSSQDGCYSEEPQDSCALQSGALILPEQIPNSFEPDAINFNPVRNEIILSQSRAHELLVMRVRLTGTN